jgi:hypothetical protein
MPFPISCTARIPLPRRRLLPVQEEALLRHLEQTMREEGAGDVRRTGDGFSFTIDPVPSMLTRWSLFAGVEAGDVRLAWAVSDPAATARFRLSRAFLVLTALLLLVFGVVSPADTVSATALRVAALWSTLCGFAYGLDLLRLRNFFRDAVNLALAESLVPSVPRTPGVESSSR